MASRYKFFKDVFNEEVNNMIKGFPMEDLEKKFTFENDRYFTIDLEYQYRPDLIAMKFYGNPKLYYILVYVNGINNSPEGFYSGRRIRIPRFENIVSVI